MSKTISMNSIAKLARRVAHGLRNEQGNAAMLFGLASVPALMAAGMAIDMARASFEHANFQVAVDSAALAIAADDRSATVGLSGAQVDQRELVLEGIAQKYFDAHYANQTLSARISNVDVQITGADVTLTADAELDTVIMGRLPSIGGWNGTDMLGMGASSTIKKAARPVELVMVMDTTGSMASGGKIAGAKTAAKQLLTTLYGGSLATAGSSEFLRTALVPFSGAVRLNPAAYDFNMAWIDTGGNNPLSKVNFNNSITAPVTFNNFTAWSQLKKTSSAYHSWNGCVEARMPGSAPSGLDYNANDAAPVSGVTLFPAFFHPDTQDSNSTGINYVTSTSLSSVGSECRGLTTTQCNSTSTTNYYVRQENYYKYVDKNIGAETSSVEGPWTNCTASAIVPMTYNRANVEAGIDAMAATGPTVIPEGLAWGWRALSPTEPFTKVQGVGALPNALISPYGDVRWQKIMVLMTDGDNDVGPGAYALNSTTYTAYGFGSETLGTNRFGTTSASGVQLALDTAMATTCANIKAKNIKLYVAAFGTGISTATKDRLKACSSNTATDTSYYAEATTSIALSAFFDHIGEDVINKSIYVSQ
jgi:Flp pilus assembly protein TadG